MSIKLDWEVESDGGWSEVGEDAAALAARKRKAERMRKTLFALVGVAVLVGGFIGFRLYTADQQARADLRATVAAETAAIRIGDSSAYLDIQQNVGSWRQLQSDRFSQYQVESGRVKADGEIVQLDIDGGKGRVVVREMVEGKPYNVVWFYQHGDSGWQHVPPEIAFWGWPREIVSAHYRINYWDEDKAFTETVKDKLETWWDTACRLTGCRQMDGVFPELMKVRIEPDPLLKLGWASYDEQTLRIPSPLLGRVPADGRLDPGLELALANYVAEHWARKLLGAPPGEYSDLAWAQSEFQDWLVSEFIPGQPPPPVLGPLADVFGPQTVMSLLGRIQQNDEVINALQVVTGKEVTELPIVWDRYLAYRLRAEATLFDGSHTTEAILLYRDPERSEGAMTLDSLLGPGADFPESITVASTRRVGEILWAETYFARDNVANYSGPPVYQTHRIQPAMTYEPFRMIAGRWVHTLALDQDYGESIEEQSQHIILRYRAIDTPTVDGLLTDLEQQYMTIVTDLGITDTPPVAVDVSPSVFGGGEVVSPMAVNSSGSVEGIRLWIGSPYSTIFPADQPLRDTLRAELTRGMALRLAGSAAYPVETTNPLVTALAQWELEHIGVDAPNLVGDPVVTQFPEPPGSLDALWAESQTAGTRGEKYVAARVLVDLVVEKIGPQAVPLLLANLPGSTGMEDWLSRSVGLHAADIETEWSLRVRAALPLTGP